MSDLQPWYDRLAPAPNTTYGSVLPFAIDEQTQQMRWALPDSVRSGLKGVLDLANSTQTGSLTGDALASVTMGSVGAGLGLAPRGALAAGAAKPIRAFHGSPHDFDRFDLSKIGTGEGAQAYGHGLYFAGNEDVAKAYKAANASGGRPIATLDGVPITDIKNKSGALDWLDSYGSVHNTLTALQGRKPEAWKELNDLVSSGRLREGHMYEVNLHTDPARFLDWDKPLSGQSGPVRALDDVYWSQHAKHQPDVASFLRSPEGAAAAKELGIPGVRYLDGGSRTAGQGSHNYVMFDDKNIEILRKYGLMAPAPVAPPGLSAPQQPVHAPGFRVARDMVY
jgi:hypothetical protein